MGFAWGLDLSPEAIRLCEATLRAGRVQVRKMAEVPLAAGLIQPSAKLPNLPEPADLADALRRAKEEAGCRGYVQVALPDQVFLLRSMTTDALPQEPAAARQFLAWQAKDLLPFPAEEARLDYQMIGEASDGRLRTVCLAARGRVLEEYEELLAAAGLHAATLDAHSVAMAQSASDNVTDRPTLLLAGGGERATLLAIEDRRPRVWRILPFPWTGDGNGERLLREVADTVTFFQESEGVGPVERVLVGGFGPDSAALAERLSAWLEVPAAALDLGTVVREWPAAADNGWGAAVGAAIRTC
jgi:hypothetical protein